MLAASLASNPWFTFTELAEWRAAGAGFAGAYPEEIGKALAVVTIVMTFRKLDRPWHGFVVGALVELGFELFENIQYGAAMGPLDLQSDLTGAAESWGLCTAVAGLLHMVWTALAGWGIGLALFTAGRSRSWRIAQVAGWFLLAFALHFAWNYDATGNYFVAKWAITLGLSYGIFAWVLAVGWIRARADDAVLHLETPQRVGAN